MTKIGYARVSKNEQSLDQQVLALKEANCDIIYEEKVSSMSHRPELEIALKTLNKGDIFVIYKLDRLGRSLVDLVNKIDYINKLGAEFISIADNFDTTTTQGKLILGITIVFAEFERNLISDRTKASLKALKEQGIKLGRPEKINKSVIKEVKKLRKSHHKISYIMEKFSLSRQSVYNCLNN